MRFANKVDRQANQHGDKAHLPVEIDRRGQHRRIDLAKVVESRRHIHYPATTTRAGGATSAPRIEAGIAGGGYDLGGIARRRRGDRWHRRGFRARHGESRANREFAKREAVAGRHQVSTSAMVKPGDGSTTTQDLDGKRATKDSARCASKKPFREMPHRSHPIEEGRSHPCLSAQWRQQPTADSRGRIRWQSR